MTTNDTDATTETHDREPPVVPWIQALGIIAFGVIGVIDLYVPDAQIPDAIYYGIVAMVLTIKIDMSRIFK